MPEEDYSFMPNQQLMQTDELIKIARLFVEQGVTKIRLTGGEPLVRKDAREIISELGKLGVELTITTNATRVQHFVDVFEEAGIRSVNISLDTLQKEKFQLITRRDQCDVVKQNIETLLSRGFKVKINVVVVKGLNDSEILDFIEWTKHSAIQIRFIEFMPFDGNRWKSDKLFTLHEILETINQKYDFVSSENAANDTSKNFTIPGHQGSFAVISTMSVPFCNTCNRIRLTADGKIKNCLFSEEESDLLKALRNEEDLLPLIKNSIKAKHKELGGQFTKQFELIDANNLHNRSMIAIGG
jgi:cyclic pyranopterin phosphate synthase